MVVRCRKCLRVFNNEVYGYLGEVSEIVVWIGNGVRGEHFSYGVFREFMKMGRLFLL